MEPRAEEKQEKVEDNVQYPFEINDIVWIVNPTYRSPLGEFRVTKALPDDKFELVKVSDGSLHPEKVNSKYLRRDPGIA
ncbi:hypothetical protein HYALB_00012256 [Hymenoscyphus albidus]|uniref:Uncharacterized protein n=1 Tax=Hymenoscyphus albidus TaxID=595503 RepID=A0A9N9PXZ6_9HELO|nr:hypothetical protein HYALB_00012256 [Hymenoscyphus albidus]